MTNYFQNGETTTAPHRRCCLIVSSTNCLKKGLRCPYLGPSPVYLDHTSSIPTCYKCNLVGYMSRLGVAASKEQPCSDCLLYRGTLGLSEQMRNVNDSLGINQEEMESYALPVGGPGLMTAQSIGITRQTKRGPWSPEEDGRLLEAIVNSGPNNWVRISQTMKSRSPKQCRERYHQSLKPSLNHEPITLEEGERIKQMVEQIGKRWEEIARSLGNRSDNAVKNWWNGDMNRRKRNGS